MMTVIACLFALIELLEVRKQHLKTSIFKPLVYVTLGHLIVIRMLTRMVLNNTFVLEGCPLGLHRL